MTWRSGVKALWSRPYFEKARVGIFGTFVWRLQFRPLSILRYPDVWSAAIRRLRR